MGRWTHDLLSSGKAFLSFQFVFLHPDLYHILCFIVTQYYYSFPWKSFVNWPKRGTIINLCIAVRQIISLTSIRATFMNYSVWIYFLLWHCSELIKSNLCRVDHWPQQEAQTIAIESTLFTFIFNVLFFHPSFCLLPKALPFFPDSRKVMKNWCWNCPDPHVLPCLRLERPSYVVPRKKVAESLFLHYHLLCSPSSIHILPF